MTTRIEACDAARNLGVAFATQLNATPHEAQNWRRLERNDDLPTEDYVSLQREHGEVTREMHDEYRAGFNATFDVSLSKSRD